MKWIPLAIALVPASLAAQDTLLVVADNEPVWPSVTLVEELRLGALDGPEHETFGSVVAVVGGMDGRTYVADGTARTIRHFDASGAYVGSFGREGSGPGEFTRINEMAAGPDGSIVVQDVGARRATVFASDGSLARDYMLYTAMSGVSTTFQVDRDGRSYTLGLFFDVPPGGRPQGGMIVESPDYIWVRQMLDGSDVDTLQVPAPDAIDPRFTVITPDGPREPYTVLTLNAVSTDGYLIWGRNDRYAFHRRLPDGRIVTVTRSATQLGVSDRERDQFEKIADFFEERGNERYPPVPAVKPYFRRLLTDVDGRVWVERYTEPYEYVYSEAELEERGDRPTTPWRETQQFDVFEPQGRFLGTVQLPQRTRLRFVRGETLWATVSGDFDEQYVVRYAIRTGS